MTRVLEGSLRAAGTVQNLFSPKASWAVEYKLCRTTGHGSTPRIVNRMDKGPVTKPTAEHNPCAVDYGTRRGSGPTRNERVLAYRHFVTTRLLLATTTVYCLLSTPTSKV